MIDFQIADRSINTYVLLLNTGDIVSRYAEKKLAQMGITPTQYTVLVTLKFCPSPPTLTELGQRLFRTKNSLTTVINKMERDGLVKRVRDESDRRAIRLVTTEKGVQLFERVRVPSRELVYQIMSCYRKQDVKQLSQLLQKVRRHILQELAPDNGDKPDGTTESLRAANMG